jgi:hypothetical protein
MYEWPTAQGPSKFITQSQYGLLVSCTSFPSATEVQGFVHELQPRRLLFRLRVVTCVVTVVVSVGQEGEAVRGRHDGKIGEPDEAGILGGHGCEDGNEGRSQEGNVEGLLFGPPGAPGPQGGDDEEPPEPVSQDLDGNVP